MPPIFYLRTYGYSTSTVATIVRYLMLRWRPDAITKETFIGLSTIYDWEYNLMKYSSTARLYIFIIDRLKKLLRQDKMALLEWLL